MDLFDYRAVLHSRVKHTRNVRIEVLEANTNVELYLFRLSPEAVCVPVVHADVRRPTVAGKTQLLPNRQFEVRMQRVREKFRVSSQLGISQKMAST